jgi:hypothetical protein
MADQLSSFHFRASDQNSWAAARCTSMEEFHEKRRGSSAASATSVRVVFDSERSLHFVDPYHLKEVSALVKAAFRVKPKADTQACTYTWSLKRQSDLEAFDELHASLDETLLLKLDDKKRLLLPQGVRGFLRLHGCAERALDDYTVSYQHFPARRERSLDNHSYFGEKLFEAMEALDAALRATERQQGPTELEQLVRASRKLQETLDRRIVGLCREKEQALPTEALPTEAPQRGAGEEGEEDAEPRELEDASWEQPHPRRLAEEEKMKKKSVDRMLRGLFSHQCTIKNSFGNILTNAGDATVLGGDLPSVTIGHEAAKSLGCWDFDLPFQAEGDLDNDDLLRMICRGPLRKGGAWTLHLWFNRAVALPAGGFQGLPQAREWLEKQLLKEGAAYFEECYLSGCGTKPPSVDELKLLLEKALRGRRLLRDVLEEEEAAEGICRWLLEHPELLPGEAQWVTAVQRHARTGDLVTVVRHPITQPVPRFLLMVDETLSGWSVRYPPQFVDSIGADYDGDKVELAIQRSRRKRDVFRRRLAMPSLCFNALGKQVGKLTGTAPLVLQLMQSNGRSQPDVYGLEKGGRSDRVLWPGVLETTYAPSVFFEALEAMGTALPRLLRPWATPLFEERSFEVRLPDGSVLTSLELGVSHDGFYPVELEATSCQKEAWIRAELLTQLDALPRLAGSRDFTVRLSEEEGPRPSALDNLTFSQMLSLVFAFVPSNFERTDGRVQVAHAPRFFEQGVARAYDGRCCSPWERMTRALLRLGARPEVLGGLQAFALELRRRSSTPSFDELAARLLEKKDPVLRTLLCLPQSLLDRDRLRSLAIARRHLLEEGGYGSELRLLDRHFRAGEPAARAERGVRPLWQASARDESWRPVLLPWRKEDLPGPLVSEWASATAACKEEASGAALRRLEQVKSDLRGLLRGVRLEVEKEGPPATATDLQTLEESLDRVVAVRQVRRLFPEGGYLEDCAEEAAERSEQPEKRRPLLDWFRFVACMRPPERVVADAQEMLNEVIPPGRDRRDYCMVLTNLEALGQKMGTFLNQPKQKQIILEDDLHMRLANFGLQEARRAARASPTPALNLFFCVASLCLLCSPCQAAKHFYERTQDHQMDFAKLRRSILEIVYPVSVSLSAAYHRGNDALVERAAFLLAADWRMKKDTVLLTLPGKEPVVFEALPGAPEEDRPSREPARSRYWTAPGPPPPTACGALVSYVSDADESLLLLLLALPVTAEEARQLLPTLGASCAALSRGRWLRLCRSLGARAEAILQRASSPALLDRVYEHEDYYLVPLAREQRSEEWCLVSRADWAAEPLSPPLAFHPGLPPRGAGCKPGPDSRLPRVLSQIKDAPERLELNFMTRPQAPITGASGRASMETGVAFTLGNMAKEGPSSILRMPVFGPRFGVRAFLAEPLAGKELSVSCLGSVSESEAAVLDNEARRSRLQEKKKKETTALCNKKATLKVDQCQPHRLGHIEGPATIDFVCRRPVPGRLCMGEISRATLRCLDCRRSYGRRGDDGLLDSTQLLHRKRLLEPRDSLLLSKRLRACDFGTPGVVLLRGAETWSLRQLLTGPQEGDGDAETLLPPGCYLSSARDAVPSFAADVIYVLSEDSSLVPHGPDGRILTGVQTMHSDPPRPEHVRACVCAVCACVHTFAVVNAAPAPLQVAASSWALHPGLHERSLATTAASPVFLLHPLRGIAAVEALSGHLQETPRLHRSPSRSRRTEGSQGRTLLLRDSGAPRSWTGRIRREARAAGHRRRLF